MGRLTWTYLEDAHKVTVFEVYLVQITILCYSIKGRPVKFQFQKTTLVQIYISIC